MSRGVITDPVGDFLTRIRNAALARRKEISSPYSKIRYAIARVLEKEGFVSDVKKSDRSFNLALVYKRRRPVINGIRNISRPGLRVYRGVGELKPPLGGIGITIVSTTKGVMSQKEAKKKGIGGEVLGEVW